MSAFFSPFRHLLLAAPAQFIRFHILFMSGQRPGMAEWVSQASLTIPPKHIRKRHFDIGACVHGSFENSVNIFDIQENVDGRAAER